MQPMSKFISPLLIAVISLFFPQMCFGRVDSLPDAYRRYIKAEKDGIDLYVKSKYDEAIAQFDKAQQLSDSLEIFLPHPIDSLRKWGISQPKHRKVSLLSNTSACKAQLGRFEESFNVLVNNMIPSITNTRCPFFLLNNVHNPIS